MSDPLVMMVAMKRKHFVAAALVVAVVVGAVAGSLWTDAGQG